jgi:hypothetical protein
MRSTAALASAFEEVAQVRYSRSGVTAGPRRANHDFDDTGNWDSALATFSTASNENNAPVVACRTSKIPGLIGASIFSPRSARGYRFHSLQVEIIAAPYRTGRYHFLQIIQSEAPFMLRSERLVPISVPLNIRTILPIRCTITDDGIQFTANYVRCCSSVVLPARVAITGCATRLLRKNAGRACGKPQPGGRLSH